MTIIDKFFDKQLGGLTKSLDLSQRRNEVLAGNIANVDTPGYRAGDLDFAGELEKAFSSSNGSEITKTDPSHMDVSSKSGRAHVTEDLSGATKADGNNVDIDIQMGQLAENAGRYTTAATLMRKQLGILKLAIREGGR